MPFRRRHAAGHAAMPTPLRWLPIADIIDADYDVFRYFRHADDAA